MGETMLSTEEFEKVKGLNLTTEAEIKDALAGNRAEMINETAAVLGIGYTIGNIEIPPITAGILPLLEAIESPLINDDQSGLSMSDIMKAVYIMATGKDAVRPIFAIQRRRAAIEKLKTEASASPELFKVYLEAVDNIECAWAQLENDAADFWENYVGPDAKIPDIANVLITALNDAFAGFGAIPGDDTSNGDEKKRPALTATG